MAEQDRVQSLPEFEDAIVVEPQSARVIQPLEARRAPKLSYRLAAVLGSLHDKGIVHGAQDVQESGRRQAASAPDRAIGTRKVILHQRAGPRLPGRAPLCARRADLASGTAEAAAAAAAGPTQGPGEGASLGEIIKPGSSRIQDHWLRSPAGPPAEQQSGALLQSANGGPHALDGAHSAGGIQSLHPLCGPHTCGTPITASCTPSSAGTGTGPPAGPYHPMPCATGHATHAHASQRSEAARSPLGGVRPCLAAEPDSIESLTAVWSSPVERQLQEMQQALAPPEPPPQSFMPEDTPSEGNPKAFAPLGLPRPCLLLPVPEGRVVRLPGAAYSWTDAEAHEFAAAQESVGVEVGLGKALLGSCGLSSAVFEAGAIFLQCSADRMVNAGRAPAPAPVPFSTPGMQLEELPCGRCMVVQEDRNGMLLVGPQGGQEVQGLHKGAFCTGINGSSDRASSKAPSEHIGPYPLGGVRPCLVDVHRSTNPGKRSPDSDGQEAGGTAAATALPLGQIDVRLDTEDGNTLRDSQDGGVGLAADTSLWLPMAQLRAMPAMPGTSLTGAPTDNPIPVQANAGVKAGSAAKCLQELGKQDCSGHQQQDLCAHVPRMHKRRAGASRGGRGLAADAPHALPAARALRSPVSRAADGTHPPPRLPRGLGELPALRKLGHGARRISYEDMTGLLRSCAGALAQGDLATWKEMSRRVHSHCSPSGSAAQRMGFLFLRAFKLLHAIAPRIRSRAQLTNKLMEHTPQPTQETLDFCVQYYQRKPIFPVCLALTFKTILDRAEGRRRVHVIVLGSHMWDMCSRSTVAAQLQRFPALIQGLSVLHHGPPRQLTFTLIDLVFDMPSRMWAGLRKARRALGTQLVAEAERLGIPEMNFNYLQIGEENLQDLASIGRTTSQPRVGECAEAVPHGTQEEVVKGGTMETMEGDEDKEAVFVDSLMRMNCIPDDPSMSPNPRPFVLEWLKKLQPELVLLGDLLMDLWEPDFGDVLRHFGRVLRMHDFLLQDMRAQELPDVIGTAGAAYSPDANDGGRARSGQKRKSHVSPWSLCAQDGSDFCRILFQFEGSMLASLMQACIAPKQQRILHTQSVDEWQQLMKQYGFKGLSMSKEIQDLVIRYVDDFQGRIRVVETNNMLTFHWENEAVLFVSAWGT